jgi:hypothetical protein
MFANRTHDRAKATRVPVTSHRRTKPDALRHGSAGFLQRQLGNRQLQEINATENRVVQRVCACGGTCAHCKAQEEKGRRVQSKLTIGPAGDRYEQEAERVAAQVLRTSEPGARQPQATLPDVQHLSEGAASGGKVELTLPTQPGRPLSTQTRAFMEPRFGANFSHVRLHTGSAAEAAADELRARAFTYGREIWLGRGAAEGDTRLMAHELTHTVQQGAAGSAPPATAAMIQRDRRRIPPTQEAQPDPCPDGVRSATIDLVSLNGSTRNPGADLDFANQVFAQCCVQFHLGQGVSVHPDLSDSWLGGDTDLQRENSCATVHTEEDAMRVGATNTFGLSSRYKVFYVASMTPALRGVNFSPDCSSGARAPFNRHVYVSNTAARRTLAHELAHIPISGLNDHNHPGGPENLMEPTNTATGEKLERSQCVEVFNNI